MDKRVNFKQLGVTGLKRYGGYVYEEFMPQLRYPRAGEIYKEMADNDAVIGSVLYLAEMLIRGTKWETKPASQDKADIEAAKFLEECMNDMESSWADTICSILSMFVYGFSVHEIVYKVRRGPMETNPKYKSKYTDCRIGWRKLPIRAQSSIKEWEFNEYGDVTACIQSCEPTFKDVRIPAEKMLHFTTRNVNGNPEGKSLLRNCYRAWYFKKFLEELEGIGMERDLAGLPVLTTPEGIDLYNDDIEGMTALRTRAEELVANIRNDASAGVVLSHGWDLKLLSSGSSRAVDINTAINRWDSRIAMTLLSDIVMMGGSQSGSYALADTKTSLLSAALQAQLENIADIINSKAVPVLFMMNDFKDITEYPKVVPGRVTTPSMKEVALVLRAASIDVKKDFKFHNFIRHLIGTEELTEDEFNEIYGAPEEPDNVPDNVPDGGIDAQPPKDTSDKTLEQNDLSYTGVGDSM